MTDRYATMRYNRIGRSGLLLPAISLGLWHNFGEDARKEGMRALLCTAFDAGIVHFDLANNYGPPPGSAETHFGEMLRADFRDHRDELVISTKAGYRMWPGPYGEWGSRKSLLASLDQSLRRMGIDHVDIFYSHRFDPDTPLEETCLALDQAVRSGKAIYAGISSYNAKRTREAAAILKELRTPLVIHQPSYSLINRWVEEDGLLDALDETGLGAIVFSPLAQGMLSGKYLDGLPEGSRATQDKSLRPEFLSDENHARVRRLGEIAAARGQPLAEMALQWVLRRPTVASALIGASRPEQILQAVRALDGAPFSDDELAAIDRAATEGHVNLWAASAERQGPSRLPAQPAKV